MAETHSIPERFRVSRATLWFDRFMNYFITMGGIGIIVAVSLIFVFILIQIIPLFRGAQVEEDRTFSIPHEDLHAFGVDEWTELPYFLTRTGEVYCLDISDTEVLSNRGWFQLGTVASGSNAISALELNQARHEIVAGFADGRFSISRIEHRAEFPGGRGRQIAASLERGPLLVMSEERLPVRLIAYGDSGTRKLAAAVLEGPDGPRLKAVSLAQRRTLFGAGEVMVDRSYELTHLLDGEPAQVLVPWEADSILVRYPDGRVAYLFFHQGRWTVRQTFRPFANYPQRTIASMNFVLGDVSIVFTNPAGRMNVWSLYRDENTNLRLYGKTKEFATLGHPASFYSKSLRNKAFLTGHENLLSLRFMTTENVRWESAQLPYQIKDAVLAPRYNRILVRDHQSQLRLYRLSDPHPSAGWRTYFGKIQYEGQSEATFTWQSTGGRDDFEPKLSMVPLLIGTLKGTLYAMFFAVPIALMAAVYTSQFLDPSIKKFVKPTMEIMASLPSVVLGFLAALWLAPIVSNAVPSVILSITGVAGGTLLFGWAWSYLPNHIRLRVRPGWEFCLLIPAAGLLGWLGWQLGPLTESIFFTVAHPDTGAAVPSFRLWYQEFFGLSFEQRNAFVVGFVMGFAVIPIIFTISEDSLSNVPEAFRSGSLALGASRWQTAIRIVLPTASAGIFSALMIGLGRAVGETMIVVMATGNVATTELNPFTGMRTLSANIAVELPEAPYLGTLYRSLFLGAMLLFLLTFLVNTVAEILRQKLRERYRAVE